MRSADGGRSARWTSGSAPSRRNRRRYRQHPRRWTSSSREFGVDPIPIGFRLAAAMTQLYDHVCVTQANSIDEVLTCISEMPDLEPAPDLIREPAPDLIREPAPDLIRGGHRFANRNMRRTNEAICVATVPAESNSCRRSWAAGPGQAGHVRRRDIDRLLLAVGFRLQGR